MGAQAKASARGKADAEPTRPSAPSAGLSASGVGARVSARRPAARARAHVRHVGRLGTVNSRYRSGLERARRRPMIRSWARILDRHWFDPASLRDLAWLRIVL